MMSLKMISLNVRGIADTMKCRAILQYYSQRANVLCLQETHSDEKLKKTIEAEWRGEIYTSHGSTASCGVAILIKKNIGFKCVKTVNDLEGRMIACELESDEDPVNRVTICNIYAPNKDRPCVFLETMKRIDELSSNLIIIGDFNLVMDVALDRKGSSFNHVKAANVVQCIMKKYQLIDIWRIRNPDIKHYSWMRAKPKVIASRIDFALVSQGLSDMMKNPMYLAGLKSDHLAFYLFLEFNNNERGPGYWKFNSSHLQLLEFLSGMNELIDSKTKQSKNLVPVERWMYLKRHMIRFAKEFAKQLASDRDIVISVIRKIVRIEL